MAAMMRRAVGAAAAAALFLCASAPAAAQSGERLDQDRVEVRGRSSLDVGAGARAYGMAGAFLARADDATAASWNPAGLSYLRRPELSIVGTHNSVNADSAEIGNSESSRSRGTTPDFAAATYPVTVRTLSGAVQLSYQRVISFTSDRTIERPANVRTVNGEGGFDVLALGAGFQVVPRVRIGATLNRWHNGYTQHVVRERARDRSEQTSEYGLRGWNVNAGLIWEPSETLNLAVVGKTPFTADVLLSRFRMDQSLPNGPVTTNAFRSENVFLDLPGAVGFGASWRPRGHLTLSVDYTRTYWSDARIRNFFTLAPSARGDDGPSPEESGDLYASLPYPHLILDDTQEDTEQVRVGVEYVIVGDRLHVPLRAGYFNDHQALRAADGAPRFHGVAVGAGVVMGPVLLDVAFLYQQGAYDELPETRTSVYARRVLASLIYRHPSR